MSAANQCGVAANVWHMLQDQWPGSPTGQVHTKIDGLPIRIVPVFDGDALPSGLSGIDRLLLTATEPWVENMSGPTYDAIRNLMGFRGRRAAWRKDAEELKAYRDANRHRPLTSPAYARYALWHRVTFGVDPVGWEFDPRGSLGAYQDKEDAT